MTEPMGAIVPKPCPFCGDDPIVSFSHEVGCWDVWNVECVRCDFDLGGPHGFSGEAATIGAVKFWNRRTQNADYDRGYADALMAVEADFPQFAIARRAALNDAGPSLNQQEMNK